jgi:hypothetical protein
MQLTEYLNQGLALANQGFDTVNSVQGLIIAVIAAGLMRSYGQIVGWAIAATIAHEAVTVVRRIIAHTPDPLLYLTDIATLKLVAVRFAGYLVAISLIYLVRRLVLRG